MEYLKTIAALTLLSWLALAQTNLIMDGNFENYAPATQITLYEFFYRRCECTSRFWYRQNPSNRIIELRTLKDPQSDILVEVINTKQLPTCQKINVVDHDSYQLSFDYLIDPNVDFGVITVTYDDLAIIDKKYITNRKSIKFAIVLKLDRSQQNILCCLGTRKNASVGATSGVLMDNFALIKVATEVICFTVRINDEDSSCLLLTSNRTFTHQQFSELIDIGVTIKENSVKRITKMLNPKSNQMELIVELKQMYSFSQVKVRLPDYSMHNSEGQAVKFVVIEKYIDYQNDNVSLEMIRQSVSYSIWFLKISAFNFLFFHLLSFANLFILYTFLNVGLIPQEIRKQLEKMAQDFLDTGLVSSIYNAATGHQISFLSQWEGEQQINKVPDDYPTSGTKFNSISLTSDFRLICFDDMMMMLFGLLKLFCVFKLLRSSKNSYLQKVRSLLQENLLELALLEVFGPTPMWVLVTGVLLGKISNLGSSSFIMKINTVFLVVFLTVFSFISVLLLILRISGNRRKLLASMSKFVKSSKFSAKTKSTAGFKRKLQKYRKQLNHSIYSRNIFQFLPHLNYILLPLCIGLQWNSLFFGTILLLICFKTIYLCKLKRQLSWFSLLTAILRLLYEALIHLIFMCAWMIEQLSVKRPEMKYKLFAFFKYFVCSLVYIYMAGAIFQIFQLLITFIFRLLSKLRFLFFNCIKNNSISDQNIKKEELSIGDLKKKEIKLQISQSINPRGLKVKKIEPSSKKNKNLALRIALNHKKYKIFTDAEGSQNLQ